MTDINKPDYYASGEIETKDFIRDKELNFFLGNVVKYVVRAGKKDKDKLVEDLKIARNYLDFEIEHVEKQEEVNDIDSDFKIFSSGKQLDLRTTLDKLGYKKIDDLTEFAKNDIILCSPLLCNDGEIASNYMYRVSSVFFGGSSGLIVDVFDSDRGRYHFNFEHLKKQDYYIKKKESD
ncbi:DUF3310 domain-containing protein [Vagococcus fessus]|uniref:DUF3310 domain-containing protein n=1 Tax=Vagococcus fessus TaxID=120370 RepID=A0A430A575_9ENTE|nr:DUF3310 domain-containing protein [Vagococcus fessus]RSU01952.1 hypothetical protein CBF31_09295 [Vagococcus fessus]